MTKREIATPPLWEARNDKEDKRRDCHGLPTGALAMTKREIATPAYGGLASMGIGF